MNTDAEVALTKIGQIAVPVQNLDRAIDFYRTKLRMPHLFTAGPLAFFDCGGIRLMLSVPESADFEQHSSIFYYPVDDIDLAYLTLSERGVQFDDEPHLIATMDTYDLWMAFFRDSETNIAAIMCEVPR